VAVFFFYECRQPKKSKAFIGLLISSFFASHSSRLILFTSTYRQAVTQQNPSEQVEMEQLLKQVLMI